MHTSMKSKKIILFIFILIEAIMCGFNNSLCGYVEFDELYYFINEAKSDINLIKNYSCINLLFYIFSKFYLI